MREFEVKIKIANDIEITIPLKAETEEDAVMEMEENLLAEIISLLDYGGYKYETKIKDNGDELLREMIRYITLLIDTEILYEQSVKKGKKAENYEEQIDKLNDYINYCKIGLKNKKMGEYMNG